MKMQLQDKKNENKALKEYRSETGSIINNAQFRRKVESDILTKDKVSNLHSKSNHYPGTIKKTDFGTDSSSPSLSRKSPVRASIDLNVKHNPVKYKGNNFNLNFAKKGVGAPPKITSSQLIRRDSLPMPVSDRICK